MPHRKTKSAAERAADKASTTRRGNANNSSGGRSGTPDAGLVSNAERADFVKAVVAGKLKPDLSTVAYHFEGWLDRDVVDAVLEATSDPTEAVSALAGMSPPAEVATATATAAAAAAATSDDVATEGANLRHARTLGAMQAQRGSCPSPIDHTSAAAAAAAAATPSVGKNDAVATSPAVENDVSESSDTTAVAAETSEGEVPTVSSGDGNCGGSRSSSSSIVSEEGVVRSFTTPGDAPPLPPARKAAGAVSNDGAAESGNHGRTRAPDLRLTQREACRPPVDAASTAAAATAPAVEDAAAAPTLAVETDGRELSDIAAVAAAGAGSSEGEVPASSGKYDISGKNDNVELEKVAAFIAKYAGEQEAAARASRAAMSKPQAPPFLVPRGVTAPSARQAQLVIARTAEKTIELPGFEAFMKIEHGKDTLFRFLSADHTLHGYYLLAKNHAQETLLHGGKAKGACAAVPRGKAPPAPRDTTPPEDPDVAEIMRMLSGAGQ